jgi:hypothetical protein
MARATLRLSRTQLLIVVSSCAGLVACADILGLHGGELVGDGGVDAAADGLPPYDGGDKDVIDLGDANFAQCDGGTDDTTGAVYVSTSHPGRNSDAQKCGAATQPCTSIQTAMAIASQTVQKKVILANDTFDEVVEFDATTNGIVVEGGYFLDYTLADNNGNPAWVYQCATSLAHIVPTTSPQNYTIRFNGAAGNTLRLVTVQSRSASKYGESVHAILAIDSTVTLDNVVAVAQNGGNGLTGAPGSAQTGCITSGQNGADGGPGAGGGPGQFTTNGFTPDTAGTGGPGATGVYVGADAGQCDPSCGSCYMGFSDAGQTCSRSTSTLCGSAGGPGCAGMGGHGGGGGQGGGASIGLYVVGNSDVTLSNGTTLFASSGGSGAAGGAGSTGAQGQTGGSGSPATCADSCGTADGGFCGATATHQLAGGSPGSGGPGGAGGTGGGGRGGPAYLLVRVQPATVNGSNLVANGDGGLGSGGAGGAPNGTSGEAVRYKVYP